MVTSDLVCELLISREVSQPGIDAACCLTYDFNGSSEESRQASNGSAAQAKVQLPDAENRTVFVFV